ncbi:hypothetical protein WN982_25115 [Paraburkholderia sp. IMGN_8]|uniref:hypothetical protein n=1 Tax=Paraburkholderia sp. IMGN_8 TaxID=3136564 RepID=UPI003100CB80
MKSIGKSICSFTPVARAESCIDALMLVIIRSTSKRANATALMEINGCEGMVAHKLSARRLHNLATAYLDCR